MESSLVMSRSSESLWTVTSFVYDSTSAYDMLSLILARYSPSQPCLSLPPGTIRQILDSPAATGNTAANSTPTPMRRVAKLVA